jgi:murein DD-endopeptidase MepM/ murein hydrolase activator NlpD
VRFTPEGGVPGYYDERGVSMKRFFLASPLKFEPRITSHFSRRRLHPVHNTVRPHLGVDYGAPHGTPVYAVAAGTVVSAGWAGGGGRQVRLRHDRGLETYYLHLSSFAPGLRAGQRVQQGQLIGRVGATGTATGPHLDFRLRKNGVFVDPVAERRRQPPGDPIPPSLLPAFMSARDGMLARLDAALDDVHAAARIEPDAVPAVE